MASCSEYLDFVLEQLSELDEISFRFMMGEYILYYRGRIFGGIYDNRLLIKPTKTALLKMLGAKKETPYEGAKEMLLVDDLENKAILTELIRSIYSELKPMKGR